MFASALKRTPFVAALALAAVLLIVVPKVYANVAVTPASGGTAISADTAGAGFTSLGAITIAEGVNDDFAISQSGQTLILTAPSGFEFNTAQIPDVTGASSDLSALSMSFPTATTLQLTFTTDGTADAVDSVVIGSVTAIQVRPTSGTPLASGDIVRTTANPGTGTIAGITLDTTNFGTLTEVHGVATQYVIIDPTDGTVDAAITVTVELQDQFGNVTTGTSGTVTLVTDGSATGGGVVTITNGTGSLPISDTVAETVNLSLSTPTPSVTFTSTQDVVFAHGVTDAGNSMVASSPGTILANGTTASTITVTLRDAFSNVVTGNTVSLAVGAGSSVILVPSGVSDGSGVVTFTVTNTVAETVTYTATDDTDGITVTQTADVIFTAAVTDAGTSTVVSSPGTILANGTTASTITVTLLDADSVPLVGHTVSLAQGAGSSVISAPSGVSDGSGVVTFTVTNTTAETVTYTAADDTDTVTVTATANVTFTAPVTSAVNSTVTSDPGSIFANGATISTITVTLKDADGVAITSGHTVTLAGTGSSVITGSPGTTDGSGVVTFTVTNTTAETVTYTATDTTETGVLTPTANVTFTLAVLTSTSVVPASLVAGASGEVVVTFTTVTAVSAGRVAVTFPAGFVVTGAGVNAASTNITGTLSLQGVSGQVVTIQGATIAAAQAGASFTLTGIQNPATTGPTGTFTIQTRDGSGTPIDEDTVVAAVSITGGAITGGAVTLTDAAAGAQTAGTVAFTLANPVASGQSIVLTFPTGWTGFNGSMTATNWTGLDGATPTSVTGDSGARTVTIVLSAEQTTLSPTLTIVASTELVNPATTGTGLTLLIDATGQSQGTSSTFSITGGAISSVTVTLTAAAAGAQTAGTVDFTLAAPVANGQDLVLTFPLGWTVQDGALTATNWTGLVGVTPTSVTGDNANRTVTIVLSAVQPSGADTLIIAASAELVNPELAQTGLTLLLDASGQTQGTSSTFAITPAAAEDDGEVPKNKSFPGVVDALSTASVTVIKNGTNEAVTIALGDHRVKTPGGPRNRGTFEKEARVVVHARRDGTQWVAIWVIVKPVNPRFVPVVGPVTGVDEDGVITILLPNGKTKKIKGPKGEGAPEVGEVVTAFINDEEDEEGDENGSGGKPATARGLVKASKTADRIQAFLEKLAAKGIDLPEAALEDHQQLVSDLADILEEHSAKHVSIINKLSKAQGFGSNSAAKIQKALEKAQAGRANGNAIAENAKGKSGLGKGNSEGKKGKSIFRPNNSGGDDDSPGKGPGKGKGKPKNAGPKGRNNSGNSNSGG